MLDLEENSSNRKTQSIKKNAQIQKNLCPRAITLPNLRDSIPNVICTATHCAHLFHDPGQAG
jgi:hypothetical protein